MKKLTDRGMVCLCKQTHQDQWNRRNNFARIRRFAASGQTGQGNIRIHDRKRQRYRCTICKQTFSARRGTMFEGLPTSTELIVIVVILLAFGCPVQAIVQAYGLDERTVASWRDRAGKQCQRVHQAIIEQGRLDLVQGPPDEIRVKARRMVAWMGLAMMVSTSKGGQVLNTSYIERFNGTMREQLATLTRQCRHAAHRLHALETGMYLLGSIYNFCCFHHELSKQRARETQKPLRQTPAMASGLTDHRWHLTELLWDKVAPPPWVAPKRSGGRPRKIPLSTFTV